MIELLFAAAAVQVESEEPAPAEIVVIRKRYDEAHGVVRRNVLTGRLACTITESSGDALIDKGVCDVALSCMTATKKKDQFNRCMADGRRQFLDSYFAMRERGDASD